MLLLGICMLSKETNCNDSIRGGPQNWHHLNAIIVLGFWPPCTFVRCTQNWCMLVISHEQCAAIDSSPIGHVIYC